MNWTSVVFFVTFNIENRRWFWRGIGNSAGGSADAAFNTSVSFYIIHTVNGHSVILHQPRLLHRLTSSLMPFYINVIADIGEQSPEGCSVWDLGASSGEGCRSLTMKHPRPPSKRPWSHSHSSTFTPGGSHIGGGNEGGARVAFHIPHPRLNRDLNR